MLTVSVIAAKDYALLVERVTGTEVVIASGRADDRLDAARRRRREAARARRGRDRRPHAAPDRLRRPRLRRRPRHRAAAGPGRRRRAQRAPRSTVARDPDRLPDRSPSPSRSPSRARCRRRSSACWRPRGGSAAGDFGVEVPTEGNDEFAALGVEFNEMARQLERRLEELEHERARLRERDPPRRRVVRQDARPRRACSRSSCRPRSTASAPTAGARRCARRRRGRCEEVAADGRRRPAIDDALGAAEAAVLDAGATAETEVGDACALAHPLRAADGGRVLGIAVGRARRAAVHRRRARAVQLPGRPGRACRSRTSTCTRPSQRQAVTDELTGLFNHRRFQEVIADEVERAKRFEPGDGPGHARHRRLQARQRHLRPPCRATSCCARWRGSCASRSREIDEPARYGGEEMAVALPQTDLDGAYLFAERVRAAASRRSSCRCSTATGSLQVTASLRRRRAAAGLRRGRQGRAGRGRRRRALPGQARREEPHASEPE